MQLAHHLAKKNLLSQDDLARVAEARVATPFVPLHKLLIERGFAKEEDVLNALAEELGMELVDVTKITVDPETLQAMPLKLVHRRGLLPISRQNGTLVVATGDPLDINALDELQTLTGLKVVPVLASPREIARLIKTHFGVGGETVTAMVQERANEDVELLEELEADDSELAKMAQEASVVKLVNEILIEAANERASDIHIEPEEDGLRIRYRIDGLLQTQTLPPEISRFQAAIISRIKIMARLNIAEKRLPQDGRIKMRVHKSEIDVRVSIIPMLHGEGIVMRLLDKTRMVFNLANVGMLPDQYKTFRQLIDRPHGIILVTGPTGSGKSTTLYSALNEIKDETVKIITVEDPVEYQQRGISQIQVHTKIGLTFASSLRSILRHDPDVVLIGEMRDLETAESAIQASLTGHLVFSTLHTNDAPRRLYPPHRHGDRAVPRGQHRGGCAGPTAGPHGLRRVQNEVRNAAGGCAERLPRGRRFGAALEGSGLPRVSSNRFPRPHRHLRAHGHRRRDSRDVRATSQRDGHSQRGDEGRHAYAASGRLAEGPERHDHHR